MQEKRFTLKLILLFNLIFIPILLLAGNTSIRKVEVRNSQTDVSVCVKTYDSSYSDNDNDVKPYIKITPNHTFKISETYNALCFEGLQPSTKYHFTLYKNMPLGASSLAEDYSFDVTTLNYKPSFSFPDKGYILPTKGEISIPVETIGVHQLEVSLYRINTRNLINSVNDYGFFKSLYSYKLEEVENKEGYKLWTKKLKISQNYPNRIKTTAIPVGDFLKKRKPGVYILQASMLDKNGEEIYHYKDETQWFMVSDIGLYTLQSDKGLTVLTKKLSSAKAYNKVKLELIAKNNEILDSVVSTNGKAFFPASVFRGQGGLEAKAIYAYGSNNDFTVLDLSRAAHDLTDRGVEGRESPSYYDAFIYSNRGIFRPGESMDFHTLLRDKVGKAQAGITVSAKVFDSREVNVYTKQFKTDGLGHFSDTLDISQSASTGKWRLALFAGSENEIANYSFLVEDFVPPKIKVEVTKSVDEIKPKEKAIISIAAKYLNGEALPNANVEVNTILHKAKNPFKQYKAYHFGDIKDKFRNETLKAVKLKTDDKGVLDIPFKIEKSYATSFPLSANIKISVNELGGRPVNKVINQFFANNKTYIGIKPNFPNNAVDMGTSSKFDLIYLTDRKLASSSLHYEVIEERTHWHWRSGGDSWEYYKTYSDEGMIQEGTVQTSATEPVALKLKKLDWGNYRLVIKDDNETISSYQFTSGYEESNSKSSPDRLPVSIDKQTYEVGNKISVSIQPKFSGPIVVYIAHDELLESKTIHAKAGKRSTVSFTVKKNWGSSAYVLATAFRAQSKKLGANRAVGIAPIKISHPEQELDISLKHVKKTASNKTVKVTVVSKKSAKRKTHFTLAAVDEGVLNLTDFPAPAPAEYFLGQRKLGIEIRDMYADLIKARGAHAQFNVGSDEEMAQAIRDDVVSNKRKVVALFTKEISFDKNGVAQVELEIPDYQGALRLMAVAWNKNATGSAKSELIVKDKISMEYYMPLFISVGDKVETLLTVDFDTTVEPGSYTIKVATGGGIVLGAKDFDVNINGVKSFKFIKKIHMTAKNKVDGLVNVKIYKNGKVIKEKHWELSVRSTYPETYVRNMGLLKKNETLDANSMVDTSVWSSVENLTLKISDKALLPIESLEDELIDYRWRCAEQTTSRAMPWLFKKQRNTGEDTIIKKAIDRLITYQKIDGGFGLWYSSRTNMWISAYVLDFLTRAKKAGYVVPKRNIDAGLNWIENNLNRWSRNGGYEEADAYGLYVLTRNGRTLMSELKYHANNSSSHIKSAQAWAHLGASFAYVGNKKLAKKMFLKAKSSLGYSYSHWYYSNYGGPLRDQAALVALMYESKVGNDWENIAADLALNTKKKTYFSTQDMSTLLTVAYMLDDIKKVDLKLLSNNRLLALKNGAYKTKVNTLSDMPSIKNISSANNWYDLSFKATPVASYYASQNNNGFSLQKVIYTMEGKEANLSNIAQNERLVIIIVGKIGNKAIKDPLITDWIPAGFELENPSLTGIDATTTLKWLKKQSKTDHKAYRNDRFAAALTLDQDLRKNGFIIAYVVRAVSAGSFTLAPSKIEDMYQPRYRGYSKFLQSKVEIVSKGNIEVVKQNSVDNNVTQGKKTQEVKPAAKNATTIQGALTEKDYLDVYNYLVDDLAQYKIVQLNFLRNSIFAHAGLSFERSNPMLHQRFLPYSWYKPSTDKSAKVYKNLSSLGKANVQALLNEEKRRGGGLVLSDFYRVNTRMLTKEYLAKYDKAQLRILRNSLFARYGLSFKDAPDLDEIYAYMPWYNPKEITASKIFDEQMNEVEKANILLMIELGKTK